VGSLAGFNQKCKNISWIKDKFNQNTFVETGCFQGSSLEYAFNLGYEKVYSCDVNLNLVNHCKQRFKDKDVSIYHLDSSDFLKEIMPLLPTQSVLFFLDAHLCGWYSGGPMTTDFAHDVNFPLEKELDIIFNKRAEFDDIIVCDDLRMYEDGPFEGGSWPDRLNVSSALSTDFLYKYGKKVSKFYADEGYILFEKL
jgi:hypothetical protein